MFNCYFENRWKIAIIVYRKNAGETSFSNVSRDWGLLHNSLEAYMLIIFTRYNAATSCHWLLESHLPSQYNWYMISARAHGGQKFMKFGVKRWPSGMIQYDFLAHFLFAYSDGFSFAVPAVVLQNDIGILLIFQIRTVCRWSFLYHCHQKKHSVIATNPKWNNGNGRDPLPFIENPFLFDIWKDQIHVL